MAGAAQLSRGVHGQAWQRARKALEGSARALWLPSSCEDQAPLIALTRADTPPSSKAEEAAARESALWRGWTTGASLVSCSDP